MELLAKQKQVDEIGDALGEVLEMIDSAAIPPAEPVRETTVSMQPLETHEVDLDRRSSPWTYRSDLSISYRCCGNCRAPCARDGASPKAASRRKRTARRTEPNLDSTIMILDDEPYNVMVVRKYLRDAGYSNLLECTDSAEAMQTIAQKKPSLLLLDIMMPKVSGLDILRALRLDEQARRFPVLILTASTDAATKREALDLGAADFLPKPVDPNDLVPRVRNALTTKVYEERLANYAEKLERRRPQADRGTGGLQGRSDPLSGPRGGIPRRHYRPSRGPGRPLCRNYRPRVGIQRGRRGNAGTGRPIARRGQDRHPRCDPQQPRKARPRTIRRDAKTLFLCEEDPHAAG